MTRARLAAVAALILVGCAGKVTTFDVPTPASTRPAPTTTKPRDLTGVPLAAVAGQTSDKVSVGPGAATISGTVVGPAGPVGGAVIEADRFVGAAVGTVEVTAGADGTWTLPHVLGGRYRLRAWRSPDLALTTPEIFFLNGTDTKSLTVLLRQFNAANASAAIAPDPPVVDQPATLVVLLTTQVVDARGVVRTQPTPGANVQLASGGSWATSDPNPAVTGADGTASWQVVCSQAGPQPLAVVVDATNTHPLNLPPCALPPPTTVPPSSTTTSTIKRRTTTTR